MAKSGITRYHSEGAKIFEPAKAEMARCIACCSMTAIATEGLPHCNDQSCYDVVARKAVANYLERLARRFQGRYQ